MHRKLYTEIQLNNGKYNSVELAKLFNVEPADIRSFIVEINKDTKEYPFGIMSKKNKYYLVDKSEDCFKKIAFYKAQYQHIKNMITLWEDRENMIQGDKLKIDEAYRIIKRNIDCWFWTRWDAIHHFEQDMNEAMSEDNIHPDNWSEHYYEYLDNYDDLYIVDEELSTKEIEILKEKLGEE